MIKRRSSTKSVIHVAGMAETEAPEAPTDQQVVDALRAALENVDLSQTTERALRKQLQEKFGVDLTDRKPLIRAEVERFLAEQEPLEEDSEGELQDEAAAAPRRGGGGGFGGACTLSPALQAFLGEEFMSRSQVVKRIWEHIKEHNLQDPTNRRKIIPDEQLGTILTPPVDMFSMNKQLSKHIFQAEGGSAQKRKVGEGGESAAKAPRKHKSKSGGEDGGRKSNGFTKQLKVSPEMADWIGRPEISRPELTSFFWSYIKENGLQDPSDKRFTVCDDKLRALTGQDRFASFGFNKYASQHFVKD